MNRFFFETEQGKNFIEKYIPIKRVGMPEEIETTARLGEQRKVNYSLVEFVPDIVGLLEENKVAILFGNERTGLTNEELLSCDETITIPTYNNTSLNLSHALAIVLYEIHKNIEKPRLEKEIKLASPKEKELIFNMLIEVIKEVNYIPHNNETLWMRNIKEFINNLNLTSRNSKIFLGLLRSTIKKLRRN
jgi:tRNA/rRNA methyltransferase